MRELGIVPDGAVALRRAQILAVGSTSEITRQFVARRKIDASGKVVMPGFVDPHTHPIFAGSREHELTMKIDGKSYMEILKSGGGILRTVNDTRRASKPRLLRETIQHVRQMITHGTTTLEAKSGYGLTLNDEVKSLQVAKELARHLPVSVVPTFLGAHAVPDEYSADPDAYVALIVNEILPRIAEDGLAEFCDVFCEQGVFSPDQSRKILSAARPVGLKPKLHADEFVDSGGAALAAELGAVSADHLLSSSKEGLMLLAQSGAVAVLLPAAPLTLMIDRYPDARMMIQMGLPVALGTDFSPSCWMPNQQMSIALACYKLRMTPAEAITSATINAAYAIGRGDEVGSLERGRRADLLVVNVPNHEFLPYRIGVNLVERVIKNGRTVAESGRLLRDKRPVKKR
jgi:imidazolonepropionase